MHSRFHEINFVKSHTFFPKIIFHFSVNNCTLENGKFLCNNSAACVPIEKVCDNQKDCADGSDESNECATYKANKICSSFNCPTESKCTILPWGATCMCPEGYQFNDRTRKCDVKLFSFISLLTSFNF